MGEFRELAAEDQAVELIDENELERFEGAIEALREEQSTVARDASEPAVGEADLLEPPIGTGKALGQEQHDLVRGEMTSQVQPGDLLVRVKRLPIERYDDRQIHATASAGAPCAFSETASS
jgi:hypothetical protein